MLIPNAQCHPPPTPPRRVTPNAPIYNIADSQLGRLLVGATEKGICAISLGDRDAEVERELMQQYPHAQLDKNDNNLSRWLDVLKNYIGDRSLELTLPLDIRGTAFQQQVWQQLQGIACGTTRTYSQIARDLGRPKAARAVASACAANPIALAIPCHRVVRSDGSLGGYRWGLERKQALLERELKVKSYAISHIPEQQRWDYWTWADSVS